MKTTQKYSLICFFLFFNCQNKKKIRRYVFTISHTQFSIAVKRYSFGGWILLLETLPSSMDTSSSSSNIFLHFNVAVILLGFQLNDSIISPFGPFHPTAILQVTSSAPPQSSSPFPTLSSPISEVPTNYWAKHSKNLNLTHALISPFNLHSSATKPHKPFPSQPTD